MSPEQPELVEGTFIDQELRAHLTDRLYRMKTVTGRAALLYVLIEHKSSPEPRIGWQLLRYQVEIWKQWERENPDWQLLPAIVPLVFYHGEETWRIPEEFPALVDAEEEWRPWLLDFRFMVVDLGKIEDRLLSRHPRLRAWLLAAKYATRDGQQLDVKEFLAETLLQVPEEMFTIMRYVVETYRSYDEQAIREIIRRVRPEEEEIMMSKFAEDIIANRNPEWTERILRERERISERKGAMTTLLRQLEHRFGDLPEEARNNIANADLDSLEAWSLRFVNARSLEEVFNA